MANNSISRREAETEACSQGRESLCCRACLSARLTLSRGAETGVRRSVPPAACGGHSVLGSRDAWKLAGLVLDRDDWCGENPG